MSTKKKRFGLSDFCFTDAHEAGTKMPILMPSGKPSGEYLIVRGPDADAAVEANRVFLAGYRLIQDSFTELEKKCADKGNFAEYNEAINDRSVPLNVNYAMAVIVGWSLDDEFNQENLMTLLSQYKQLPAAVIKFHAECREHFEEK